MKDKLQIFLITYNRAACLDRSLAQVLADDSPVRDFDITILDNKSTDGTVGVIRKWQAVRPNLKHIRHNRNISGNGNIVRAMELATKEYLWTLCDDDEYDWQGWKELEERINAGDELICVADYLLDSRTRSLPEYQMWQMSFVPAIVARTSLFTETLMRNAYDNIYTMFPHLVLVASYLNAGGKIYTLTKHVLDRGHAVNADDFVRGCVREDVFVRNRQMNWLVGYANIATNVKDRSLARRCFYAPIDGPTANRIGWWEVYAQIFLLFRGRENKMHLVDIMQVVGPWSRMIIRIIGVVQNTPLYWITLKFREWHARLIERR